MYYPSGLAESVFAQACVLAKMMGLHQARSVPEGVSMNEAQERFKVFRSLYLRDKSFSISRGSICWLPSFDCSLSSELGEGGPTDLKFAVRIQLARLKDEGYRLFHSADSPRPSSAGYRSTLLNLEQSLEHWACANEIFISPWAGTGDVDLQLEFLAARICILRKSNEPDHVRRSLADSRASCLLVLISHGKYEPSMIEQLNALLLPKSPSEPLVDKTSGKPSKSSKPFSPDSAEFETSNNFSPRSRDVFETFSVSAFFLLAINMIGPSSAYDESNSEEDLILLKSICACFKEHVAKTQVNNHTRKIGRAFESLLEVVNLTRNSQHTPSSQCGVQQSNDFQGTSNTSNALGVQYRLSEFSDLPNSSASSISHIAWERPSNKNTATTKPDWLNAGASTSFSAPIDSHYRPYDPLRHDFLPSHTQQQIVRPASPNHPIRSELDVSMNDYAGPSVFSGFPTIDPFLSFDTAH